MAIEAYSRALGEWTYFVVCSRGNLTMCLYLLYIRSSHNFSLRKHDIIIIDFHLSKYFPIAGYSKLYSLYRLTLYKVTFPLSFCIFSTEANKHDFRGYYGLGHTYEVLNMSYFALYYYKQAQRLRWEQVNVCCTTGRCKLCGKLHILLRLCDCNYPYFVSK